MTTFREKLFLAVGILIVGGFFIWWAYSLEEKLRDEGYKTKKIVLYVVGGVVLLVGAAGLSESALRRNDIFGFILFNDLFNFIARLAF